MSIAVIITYRDAASPGPRYLPLATEVVFSAHWLPAAAALGCSWLPLFQTGTPVDPDELPAVRAELERVRDHFARAPEASEQLRERSRWLVEELARLDPAEIREIFIG
jgi:hypothetical protein